MFTWALDGRPDSPPLPAGYRRGRAPLRPQEILEVVLKAYGSDPAWAAVLPEIDVRMTSRVETTVGQPGFEFVGLYDDDSLVAVSGLAVSHWTGQNLLTGVCVLPGHQRRGLGRVLLALSLQWLRDSGGLREARVFTEEGSLADRKLYPLFGSRRVSNVIYPGAVGRDAHSRPGTHDNTRG